ncbi:hypothetical protein [Luteolibacter sp. Populi]|uniref:hypothetical protein n=1 Tax=Luteolibacter sp. Populi TaxID=3230487 RepID=UPI003465E01B
MKTKYFSILGVAAVLAAASPNFHPFTTAHALETEAVQPKEEDMQILTRGPVHEAFAEAVSERPEPGFIVTKAVPSPIEELPPEQQLEGDNVTWISGYWAWDDDTTDFLWISGVWRNIPPGRQWVPGYWSDLNDGRWQWTSGYWADSENTQVDYVEEAPPASVDAGPNIEAPDEDSTWIPGNWRYAETRYVWSPGYYTPLRPDWTWVPSRWCWSPRGYSYVDGYWDYAIENRGVLFAPVYYRRPLWSDPGYYYTPSVVVSLGVFNNHCWIRPRSGHYYFGDYYAPRYGGLGFYPSYAWHGRRGCYDPIWAHNRWNHRHDHGWNNRFRDRFNFFRDNEGARPLHTWAAMRDFRNDRFSNDDRSRSRLFASSLNGFAKNPVGGERFRPLDQNRRAQIVAQRQEMRDFTQQRRQLERRPAVRPDNNNATRGEGRTNVVRQQLRRSPVVGRQAEKFAQNQAPPRRPQARGTQVRPDAVVRPNAGRNALAEGRGRGGNANRAVPQVNRDRVQPGAGKATPQRTPQVAPGREGQAQRQAQPQRQQARPQPQRQAQPQRQQARPQPQRQVQPQRQQARPQPQRQVQPQRQQARPQPQRQVQPQRQQVRPQPQRQAQPQRQQARPQPQRQAQPQRQQARPQPQRQAQPQRQVQPQRQQARPQAKPQPQRQAAPQRQQARPQPRSAPQRQSQQQQRGRNRSNG